MFVRRSQVDGKTVVAVAGLDLDMPAGQITGLLGANGAGKTTTISMLTGLIEPSGGKATIDGMSISNEMQAIRHTLGVCPQLNVIFEPLTPVQHLHLCAAAATFAAQSTAVATLTAQRSPPRPALPRAPPS